MSDGKIEYEVRADISHLTADLNNANQAVRNSAQQTQRQVDSIGKTAESAIKPLTEAAEDAAESIDELGDSANDTAKEVDKLGDTEQETKDKTKGLGEESEKASKKIKEHGEQSKKSAEHTDKLKDSTDKLKSSLKDAGQTIGKYAAAAGAAFTAVGTAAIKSAAEAETSFAKVKTLLSDKIMVDDYYNSIKTASANTGVDFGSMAESVYSAISASVDENKAVDFAQNAVKLAKGGFTETATAVDVLTTAINAYGLAADDATHISDVLITTQNAGKTTVDELAHSMGPIIPIAKNAGESIEGLCTELAIMTKNGNGTAESVTMLKSMFSELSSTGSNVDKTLREISGKSFAELKAEGQTTADVLNTLSDYAASSGKTLKDMFGSVEAGTAALSLVSDGGADFVNILDQMQNSAGATEKAYETMANTIEERFNKLKNKFTLQFTEIGEKLLPQIEKFADYIDDHFDEISDTIEDIGKATEKALEFLAGLTKTLWEHKEAVAAVVMGYVMFKTAMSIGNVIAATVTAVKSLSGALKTATTAQQAMNAACNANPYVVLASLILGVVTAIGTFIASSNSAADSAENLDNKIKELSSSSKEYKNSADGLEKITKKYDEIYNSEKTTAEKTEELKTIQDELVSQYGDLAGGIDIVNGKYDEQIQKLKELTQEERNLAEASAREAYLTAQQAQKEYSLEFYAIANDPDAKENLDWMRDNLKTHNRYHDWTDYDIWDNPTKYNSRLIGSYEEIAKDMQAYYSYLHEKYGSDAKNSAIDAAYNRWQEAVKKAEEYKEAENNYGHILGENALSDAKSGKSLDEEHYQALIKLYPELKDKIEETTDGYIVEAEALEELEKKQKAATNATNENAEANKNAAGAAQNQAVSVENLINKYGDLYKVLENVKNGGAMNFEQMQNLITLYPELANKIELTADGYIIEADALTDLETALDNTVDAQIEAERERTQAAIDGARTRMAIYSSEIAMMYQHGEVEKAKAAEAKYKEAQKTLNEESEHLRQLNATGSLSDYLRGQRGSSGSSSGGGSGSSANPNESAYDKEYATLKYRHDMGEISDSEFYSGIGSLRDKYLDADSDKWRAANVSIHQWEESQKKGGTAASSSGGKSGNNISITSYIPTLWDTEEEADRKLQQALGIELAGNSSYGHIMSGIERSAAVSQMSAVSTGGATTAKEATLNDVISAINELQKADENRQISFDVVLKARDLTIGRVAVADINDITKIDGKTPLIIK